MVRETSLVLTRRLHAVLTFHHLADDGRRVTPTSADVSESRARHPDESFVPLKFLPVLAIICYCREVNTRGLPLTLPAKAPSSRRTRPFTHQCPYPEYAYRRKTRRCSLETTGHDVLPVGPPRAGDPGLDSETVGQQALTKSQARQSRQLL